MRIEMGLHARKLYFVLSPKLQILQKITKGKKIAQSCTPIRYAACSLNMNVIRHPSNKYGV